MFTRLIRKIIVLVPMLSSIQLSIVTAKDATLPNILRLDHDEDWQAVSTLENVCGGTYLRPQFLGNLPKGITIKADKGQLSEKTKSVLSGNVIVENIDKRLFANELILYRNDQAKPYKLVADDNTLFETPNLRIQSQQSDLNLKTKNYRFQHTFYRFYDLHARGYASAVQYQEDMPIILKSASYTSCAPSSDTWKIQANKVILDNKNNQGYAYGAKFKIKNFPVVYLPYVSFPINNQRKSGLLIPIIRYSKTSGSEINIPVYFNLAPNYDTTVMFNWFEKRGMQYANNIRMLGKNQHFNADSAILPNDKQFGDTRYSYNIQYNNQLTSNLNLQTQYANVSDNDYFTDFSSDIISGNSRYLPQNLMLDWISPNLHISAILENYKTLQPTGSTPLTIPYKLMPGLNVNYENQFQNTRIFYKIDFSASRFDNSTNGGLKPTVGNRYIFVPSVEYLYQTPFFYFNPNLKWHASYYDLDLSATDLLQNKPSSISRNLPIFEVKSGIFFDRDVTFFGKPISQSLQPKLQYTYIPYRNHNDIPLFDTTYTPISIFSLERYNRFTGNDRIGDLNRFIASLGTTFSKTDSLNKLAEFKLSQPFYLQDRRVSLCNNQAASGCLTVENPEAKSSFPYLLGEGSVELSDTLSLMSAGLWHYKQHKLSQYHMGFLYQVNDAQTLNMNYYRVVDEKNLAHRQVDSKLALKIGPKWNIIAALLYDLSQDVWIDSQFGLGFEDCCWAFNFGLKRYQTLSTLENNKINNALYFQFTLKGLTNNMLT